MEPKTQLYHKHLISSNKSDLLTNGPVTQISAPVVDKPIFHPKILPEPSCTRRCILQVICANPTKHNLKNDSRRRQVCVCVAWKKAVCNMTNWVTASHRDSEESSGRKKDGTVLGTHFFVRFFLSFFVTRSRFWGGKRTHQMFIGALLPSAVTVEFVLLPPRPPAEGSRWRGKEPRKN